MLDKKGQVSTSLVTGLVFGVVTLIIGVIIALTITSTLTGADLLTSSRTTVTVTNEAGFVNETGYTLAEYDANTRLSFTITALVNTTDDDGGVFLVGNATITDGVVTNSSETVLESANITYTYITKTAEELTSTGLSTNLTEGINNVSTKIPTVLLVAAIVLILGVLAVLIAVWQRMKFSGSTL